MSRWGVSVSMLALAALSVLVVGSASAQVEAAKNLGTATGKSLNNAAGKMDAGSGSAGAATSEGTPKHRGARHANTQERYRALHSKRADRGGSKVSRGGTNTTKAQKAR